MTAVIGWRSMTDMMAVLDESMAPEFDEALPDVAASSLDSQAAPIRV